MRPFRLNIMGVVWTAMFLMAAGLEGCNSGPKKFPDGKKIQQNADEGMRDLEKEEQQRNRVDR